MKKILLVLAIIMSSLVTTGCEDLLKKKEEVAQVTPSVNDTIVNDAMKKIIVNSENELSGFKKEGNRWVLTESMYASYRIVENKFISIIETKVEGTFMVVNKSTLEVAKDGKLNQTLEELDTNGNMKVTRVKTYNNVDEYLNSIKR